MGISGYIEVLGVSIGMGKGGAWARSEEEHVEWVEEFQQKETSYREDNQDATRSAATSCAITFEKSFA